MILHLINQKCFGLDTKLFTTSENTPDNSTITGITLDGVNQDITDVKVLDMAIDFVNAAKITDSEEDIAALQFVKNITSIFGINDVDSLVADTNGKIDNIIEILSKMKNEINSAGCNANTDMDKWMNIARRYMDEVIDPNDKMPAAEYNKMLQMFTMYNAWVMKR